jgi:peptide subunit release factor 1 (eRF1)
MDVVPASARARDQDVVAATLSSFIACEQQVSLDTVALLVSALRRGGLGVAGATATVEALRRGQADVLVMARAYEPEPAWTCRQCGWTDAAPSPPGRCAECGSSDLQSANLKEMMVKLAERQSIEIELVQDSDVLMELGGVGCLLRWEMTVDLGGS